MNQYQYWCIGICTVYDKTKDLKKKKNRAHHILLEGFLFKRHQNVWKKKERKGREKVFGACKAKLLTAF